MSNAPLMPMATAVWLVENTTLIIEEAGGKVNHICETGDETINIRASNSNIYQKMLEKIKNF